MTPQSDFVQPPQLAVWLIDLFTPTEEAEFIPGDLLEEFSHLASKSGVAFARSWYWRQTMKTSAHLAAGALRSAPRSTAAAVAGGVLLEGFVYRLPERVLATITDRYLAYCSAHFTAYMFLATDGMLIAHIIASLFVGCIVALAAKGREMVATIALGFVLGAMAGAGGLVWVAKGYDGFLWMMPWYFADSCAIAVGGAIVRTRRGAMKISPSGA